MTVHFFYQTLLILCGLFFASVNARSGRHAELSRRNVTSHLEILVRRFTTVTDCDHCGDNSCPVCCGKGYYKGDNYPVKCVADESLCDPDQPIITDGRNCKTCLGCGGNRCDEPQFKCTSKEDEGDCCIPNDGKGTKFYWFCKGCAPCPSGYHETTYRSTKYNCVSCKTISNPNEGVNCF